MNKTYYELYLKYKKKYLLKKNQFGSASKMSEEQNKLEKEGSPKIEENSLQLILPCEITNFTKKILLSSCISRNEIAKILNVKNSEIIFTSGGTEGDNLIIRNSIKYLGVKHIITSKIEHHAVTHTVDDLQKNKKIKVSYVKISPDGSVDYEDLENLLSNSNIKTLVSLMHINNEIGNILDINKVSDLTKKYSAYFHSDTVQSIGHYEMDLKKYNIDFVVAS